MHERRFTDLLTAAVVATYVLVALGAAVATRGADCGTWPLCVDPFTLDGATAVAHRGAALVAGLLVAGAAIGARRTDVPKRVRWLLAAAAAGFLGQVLLGAAIVVGAPGTAARLHLGIGVGLFALLTYALVVSLEAGTTGDAPLDATIEGTTGDAPLDATGERVSRNAPIDATTPEPSVATAEASPAEPANAGRNQDDRTGVREDERDDRSAPREADRDDRSALREDAWTRPSFDPAATVRAYVSLTKPRLVWLLCLLAVAGMGLAALAGSPPTGLEAVATLAGGVLAIGASGVANHVYERDRDRRMERTADRPLAREHVSVRGAVAFGAVLTVGALAVPWLFVSALVAALIGVAMLYYGVVYTVVLKPNTRWSTLIGGGSGALPAVIGWAAGTGTVDPPALALAGIVVLWTPAHFYNLALAYREDYARGGFPLVPVVEGTDTARRRIVGYLAATLLAASALGAMTDLGLLYALATAVAGGGFLYAVVVSFRKRTDAASLRAFYASNAFLGVVLVAIVLEAAVA